MTKKRKDRQGIVYSTNPDYQYDYSSDNEEQTLPPGEQKLYVSLDRKGRKGKAVTLVAGFTGTQENMKDLGRELKIHCGSGGSVDRGVILVQGDCRVKVMEYLTARGYQVKKSGG